MIDFNAENLLSAESFVAFVTGCAITYGIMTWRLNMTCTNGRWGHQGKWRLPPLKTAFWVWVLIFGGLLYIGWQNQSVRNDMARLSGNTAACQEQLIVAIKDSRGVTNENDRLSRTQRTLFSQREALEIGWITALINPPEELRGVPQQDPLMQAYGMRVTREYAEKAGAINKQIIAIEDQQMANEKARPTLPSPTCASG